MNGVTASLSQFDTETLALVDNLFIHEITDTVEDSFPFNVSVNISSLNIERSYYFYFISKNYVGTKEKKGLR